MVLDATSSLGEMAGARYIESLKDGREVWLDGEKVQDVTTHPTLSGIAHELARALEYAHSRLDDSGRPLNIIHRDVSPPNVLIGIQGEVKLTDFGVAKAARTAGANRHRSRPRRRRNR